MTRKNDGEKEGDEADDVSKWDPQRGWHDLIIEIGMIWKSVL